MQYRNGAWLQQGTIPPVNVANHMIVCILHRTTIGFYEASKSYSGADKTSASHFSHKLFKVTGQWHKMLPPPPPAGDLTETLV